MPRTPFPGVRGRLLGVSRWRRLAAVLGAIGVSAIAIGIIVVTVPGSSQGASKAPRSSGATTVQRRDLVATDTESGTLSYADPQTVFNRLSGTITSLPAVGEVIKPGQILYHVSGAPVVLFDGTVPAYRDLTSGDSNGTDILELNQNLRNLGFDPNHQLALNDTWQSATTTAVDAWQASLGQTQTGTVTLGQIVFLPGAQRVTSVDTVLGSTGGSGGSAAGSGSSSSTAYTPSLAPRTEFVSLTSTPSPASSTAAADRLRPNASTAACGSTGAPASGTTTTTSTTSTTPTTTTTSPTTTTTTPTSSCTPTTGGGTGSGAPKPAGKTPSPEAILLALLKAETLELKKSLSGSAGASSRSSSAGSSAGTGASASPGGSGASAASAGTSSGSGSGSSSSGSSGASAASGSGSASAQAILQTTSNELVVTVNLDATKQSEAVVGEPVTVQLPNGDTVNGKITEVSPVAQSSSSSTSSSSGSGSGSGGSSSAPSATVPVTIQITGRHPTAGLDQAAVSVNFQQQVENNVLSVPVTALLATPGGGYAVQEVNAPRSLIAVTPGLFAAGYVQISGAAIYPGLQVTDSQG